MSKNIVICCDGTANEFAKDNTNVVKLYATLVQDGPAQCAYYHPGIGTMEPLSAFTPLQRKVSRAMGLAFGAYLENDIRDAYAYLMQAYEPGDKVFLFGFSRGAYTARAVASLVRMYGLLRRGNEANIPYAIRMMMAIKNAHDDKQKVNDYFDLAGRFKDMMARPCPLHFVGVWDTVSSVGWVENPLKLPFSADNGEIAVGRHAIALDERRAFFRQNLWRPAGGGPEHGPADLLQVWFPGVHCDVGGGYAEADSGLSKLALEWMLDEAEEHGLLVDPGRRADVLGGVTPYVRPNPDGLMHESLTGAWKVAEYVPKKHYDYATKQESRRANKSRRRTPPQGSIVHWSVKERDGGNYFKTLGLPPDTPVYPKKTKPP